MSNAKPNTPSPVAVTESVTPISMVPAPRPVEAQSPDVLMERIRQLETEKAAAQELASGFQQQCEQLKARVPVTAEMKTTTTKPVYTFAVDGPNGVHEFDVVDESEAKRLYCIQFKLDPSLFPLKVICREAAKRQESVIKQFTTAGWKEDAIPKHLIPAA